MSERLVLTKTEILDRFTPHDDTDPAAPWIVGATVYVCPECGDVLDQYEACPCEVELYAAPPDDGWRDDDDAGPAELPEWDYTS